MPKIEKDSFVVVSDLHSTPWTLKKIKEEFLEKYDKIFILGDVTDRGENSNGKKGILMLRIIKEMTEDYPNRVIYIPGNHDYFLFKYATLDKEHQNEYRTLQIKNGGYYTYKDLEDLKITNQLEYLELISWLSKQPLQYIHEFNNQKYALAHALFDMSIYKLNKDANLTDYIKNKEKYHNILWFRKIDNFTYEPQDMPDSSYKMIIGHTPAFIREDINLDVLGKDGKKVKVSCVDNGVFLSNGSLGVYDCYLGNCYTTKSLNRNIEIKENYLLTKRLYRKLRNKFNHEED